MGQNLEWQDLGFEKVYNYQLTEIIQKSKLCPVTGVLWRQHVVDDLVIQAYCLRKCLYGRWNTLHICQGISILSEHTLPKFSLLEIAHSTSSEALLPTTGY